MKIEMNFVNMFSKPGKFIIAIVIIVVIANIVIIETSKKKKKLLLKQCRNLFRKKLEIENL